MLRRSEPMAQRSIFRYLSVFFVIVGLVVFYVWERVTAVRLTIQLEERREELSSLENELNLLKIQLSSVSSRKRLEPLAKKLGMRNP